MADYFIHETSIADEGAKIGKGTKIWHFSHVQKGAVIGESCSLGQNVNIGENAVVGNHVKIQNNVSVYGGVVLEDYVFWQLVHGFHKRSDAPLEIPQRLRELQKDPDRAGRDYRR